MFKMGENKIKHVILYQERCHCFHYLIKQIICYWFTFFSLVDKVPSLPILMHSQIKQIQEKNGKAQVCHLIMIKSLHMEYGCILNVILRLISIHVIPNFNISIKVLLFRCMITIYIVVKKSAVNSSIKQNSSKSTKSTCNLSI